MSLRAAALLLALFAASPAFAQGGNGAQPAPGKSQPQPPPQAPPARAVPTVRAILVEGEQRYSEAQLISALGQKVGEPLDELRIDRGLHTLWDSFHVRGSVHYREVAPASEGKPAEVELLLTVVEMPSDREPRFVGNVEIPSKTLKRWALLEDRVELFEYQTNRVRQRLLEGYRRDGFYWVEVDVVTGVIEPEPGEAVSPMTDVIFEIREGPKVRVKGVDLRGNQSMPDRGVLFWKDGLSSFAKRQLKPPSMFSWRGSPFVMETLEADVLAMRNVYRERGWLDAVVDYELEWSDDRSKVYIELVVDEGRPYTVEQLTIEFLEWYRDEDDNERLRPMDPERAPRHTAEELLAKCDLEVGGRYEAILVNRDSATLRDLYGEEGYLSHPSLPRDVRWSFLEPALYYKPEAHALQVTYRIVEGRPLTLREITFAGSHHTRDEVLRREISVFPGGKADLKEILKGLNRIQATGFFSNQFAPEEHLEPTFRFLPVEGSKDLIDLEYQVEEGRVVEFNISGGVDSNDGVFALITLSMRNFDWKDTPTKWSRVVTELLRKEAFHGDGQRVDIELSPGTRVSRARLHFLEPDIFDLYLRPVSLDVDLRQQLRIYDSHDEERFDKAVKLGRRLSFDTSVSLGLIHSEIDVSDLDDAGVPLSLQRQEAMGSVVQSGFTVDAHTRDLDNYLNPHNGWKVSLRNSLFTKLLSSDFEYLRTEVQFDGYLATGTKEDGTEHVLHLEFDAGVMPTFGDTDEVPYTERFFQGGSSTLRGFPLRGAGNRGVDALGAPTEFAAGGETYLSGTVEWLYPLYSITQPGTYRKIESLRGILFLDWGVLGPEAFELDLADTRASAGFGLGLAYPLPIQLNFGFPIRSFSGDERQTFSFSIGITF